jgi:hypothetical protein
MSLLLLLVSGAHQMLVTSGRQYEINFGQALSEW